MENKEKSIYKSLEEFPEIINNKKKLFLSFQEWLKGDENEGLVDEITNDFVYLRQWKLNKKVFCFCLLTESSSIIQVILFSYLW